MTKIKNGRLLLTVPAIIGMAVCIAVCILLSCLTLAGQSPARRGGVHTGSAQHVFLALHGRL